MSDPIAVMRNRVTTEFRKVAPGSEEYLALQAQRDPNDGQPVWEETSLPNAAAQSKRLDEGNPEPHDFGTDQQPVGRIVGAPEQYVPASQVTDALPSEREAGVEAGARVAMPPRESAPDAVPVETDVSGTEPELENSGASAKKSSRSRKAANSSESSSSS